MAHEVAHVLGVQEVYLGSYDANDKESHLSYMLGDDSKMPCIMASMELEGVYNLVQDEANALCETCRGYLKDELEKQENLLTEIP